MRRMLLFAYVSVLIFSLSGCMSYAKREPELTSLQRRVMEAKELNGTFDDAFKATLAVLQDKGYEIKNSDYQGGIISGISSLHLELGIAEDTATITFEEFTEDRVKIRVSIFRQFYNVFGSKAPGDACEIVKRTRHLTCTDLDTTGVVESPEIYQDFYAEVQKEMFRRAQLNK